MRTKELPAVVALLVAGVWLLALPTGAAADGSPLNGPQIDSCDGPKVGHTTLDYLADFTKIKLKVRLTDGPPNQTFDVFWKSLESYAGCPNGESCEIKLGQFTTDDTGQGVFKFRGAPPPCFGKFTLIHVSSEVGVFTSIFGNL